MTLEVVIHSVDEFFHGKLLIVKYVELDRGKCIGNGSDTNTPGYSLCCILHRLRCSLYLS